MSRGRLNAFEKPWSSYFTKVYENVKKITHSNRKRASRLISWSTNWPVEYGCWENPEFASPFNDRMFYQNQKIVTQKLICYLEYNLRLYLANDFMTEKWKSLHFYVVNGHWQVRNVPMTKHGNEKMNTFYTFACWWAWLTYILLGFNELYMDLYLFYILTYL